MNVRLDTQDSPPSTSSPVKTSFQSLPLELRQAIFLHTATDFTEECKIRVEFTLSEDANDGSGKLQSQALDALATLRQLARGIRQDATDYLTGPSVCWILVSETQPHMYLLRALRKRVPQQVLGRIEHVCLARVTLNDHLCPPPMKIEFSTASMLEVLERRPGYAKHMGMHHASDPDCWFEKVKSDFRYGFSLLPQLLPAVRQLDIDLDIVDCLYNTDSYAHLVIMHRRNATAFWEQVYHRTILHQLVPLGNMQRASIIDLHIYWQDFGVRERICRYHFDESDVQALRPSLVDMLKQQTSFKSIIGHA